MIEVSNGYNTTYLDNNDEEVCRVTIDDLREIENSSGRIEKLNSQQIKSYLTFIHSVE